MSDVHNTDDTSLRKRHEHPSPDRETISPKEALSVKRENGEQNSSTDTFSDKISKIEVDGSSSSTKQRAWRSTTCYIPKRVIVTFLLGIGLLLVYSMRTNVGVTVVIILDERAYEKVGTMDTIVDVPQVYWDSRMVGFLHSIFYIGFLISQIPGAFFTTILPSHKLYSGCILTSAMFNFMLPFCINNGLYSLVCVVRCCQGLAEGMLYPACYGVLRHWTAPSERSRQVSAVLSCAYAGAILGFPLAGIIAHYLGWEYIFYVCGSLCIVWFMFWLYLVYEKPSHHKSISETEFEFMEKAQGEDVIDYENVHVPWRSMLTSLPVISICLCHFARYWIFVLMLTNEPLYLNEFGFNIAETGVYACLPHVAKVILSFASGYIADSLLNSKLFSTGAVRKLLTGTGLGLQSVGFFVLTLLNTGTVVIIVLTITVGVFGLTTSGWSVNHYDLSTRYASSLVAMTSAFGSLGAIAVPLATGALTMEQTIENWDNVFYLTASIIAGAAIFYLIFGSGEQQHWSNLPDDIFLVQKVDPLARKPYGTFTVQKPGKDGNCFHPKISSNKKPYNTYNVPVNTVGSDTTNLSEFNENKNVSEGRLTDTSKDTAGSGHMCNEHLDDREISQKSKIQTNDISTNDNEMKHLKEEQHVKRNEETGHDPTGHDVTGHDVKGHDVKGQDAEQR